jgi:hypothetical protein
MKTITFVLALVLSAFCSHAQTTKITIYCYLYTHGAHQDIKFDYGDADKFLPDSIKTAVLIDYSKQYLVRSADENNIILLMSAEGWKLAATLRETQFEPRYYVLSKEIPMDEPTRKLYEENIKSSFKNLK